MVLSRHKGYLRARGELFDLLLKNYRGSGSQRFIAFAAALPHPLQMNFAGLISAFTSSYFALFFIISQMWLSCPSCGIVFTLIITKSKAYKPTLCACSRRWRRNLKSIPIRKKTRSHKIQIKLYDPGTYSRLDAKKTNIIDDFILTSRVHSGPSPLFDLVSIRPLTRVEISPEYFPLFYSIFLVQILNQIGILKKYSAIVGRVLLKNNFNFL